MRFEWDAEKAERNQQAHGVSFGEAQELFRSDPDVLEIYDLANSVHEDRFKSIGPIRGGLVLVVWTERAQDTIRIISARWATPHETALYREFVEALHG